MLCEPPLPSCPPVLAPLPAAALPVVLPALLGMLPPALPPLAPSLAAPSLGLLEEQAHSSIETATRVFSMSHSTFDLQAGTASRGHGSSAAVRRHFEGGSSGPRWKQLRETLTIASYVGRSCVMASKEQADRAWLTRRIARRPGVRFENDRYVEHRLETAAIPADP
jgi:hypothetical protein